MTRFAGPLPGERKRNPGALVLGSWRAVVETVTPELTVSVPKLTGQGVVIRHIEVAVEVLAVTPLAVGDRVWVQCIEGVPTDLLVIARRF